MGPTQTIPVGRHEGFASTQRVDRWWIGPASTALGLVIFFGYLTLRAFDATYVWYDPYISPTVAPAFFIPWMAIAFRFTCYYYRGAYYKAFAMTPPACGVRGVSQQYRGEAALLLFQNLHRYTLYGAIFLLACLWWEGLAAFFRAGRFGIGVGTVVMLINAALLTGYTFGCHSWRHLIGGRLDCFTCESATSPRYGLWKGSSWLNERHMAFAWLSLVWVAFTDFYIYLVSSGTMRDLNTW
jgi:hypothetical protein